ncbi:High light inducible protein [Seminavis robusta]|uniref:High light inducible protein n=1 Tax=Seminavis robusta TaxID=568900 RepID=A0A9N8EPT2_9STRA|nr:High light inducible protein [Seminavis robusta]|eukprot:Sro1308_g261430.1 High light inducible protein (176) ;mRNA; r:8892-9419
MHKASRSAALLILSSALFQCVEGFSTSSFLVRTTTQLKATKEDAEKMAESFEEPKLTEAGLPELKGDFDWDAKFGGDEDWITEDVPGKVVLDDVTLAQQVTALDQLETKWRKDRLRAEYDDSKKVGFVGEAELLNGRFAMFFLATGLLTELWTGISLPGQVEEMLRIGGFIGFGE